MRSSYKTIGLWVVLICLFVAFYQVFQHTEDEVAEIPITSFLDKVNNRELSVVRIKGTRYSGEGAGGLRFRATGPVPDAALLQSMRDAGVEVRFAPPEDTNIWLTILSQWMPVIVLFVIFSVFVRWVRSRGAKVPEFKIEPRSLADPGPLKGLDEPRARLRAAADGLRNMTPGTRRVLISGPPGSGKTSLVKAAAADSGLKALVVAGSEFNEVFVGQGAKRVRELFEAASRAQPVIVVIEDLDAIAKQRTATTDSKAQDEREQAMLELCQWLDGLKTFPDRTLLIATTNRFDLLDAAITRPGRFQVQMKLTAGGATVEG